jgi:hypothetical protein
MEKTNETFNYKGNIIDLYDRGWVVNYPDKKEEIRISRAVIDYEGLVVGSEYNLKSNDFNQPKNERKPQPLLKEDSKFQEFRIIMNDPNLPKLPLDKVLINALMQELFDDNIHCYDYYDGGTFFQPMTFNPDFQPATPKTLVVTKKVPVLDENGPTLDEDGNIISQDITETQSVLINGIPAYNEDGSIDLGTAIDGNPVKFYLRDLSEQPIDDHPLLLSGGVLDDVSIWTGLKKGKYLAYAIDASNHFNAIEFEI